MKKVLTGIVIGLMVAAMGSCLLIASLSLDGTKAWFISRLPGFEDSTVYASGYSEEAFRDVYEGMTTQELVQALGPPLHIWPAPPPPENRLQYMNWAYTKSARQEDNMHRAKGRANIRIRTVGVHDGKVAYKNSRLVLDTDWSFQ